MITGVWETTARQFYTGNTSLNRNILLKHGGFDPQFRRAEDVELAYRLHAHGIRFFFCPDAIGYHYEQRSFKSWLDIPYAYGRNDVIFTYEKGNTWLLPWIFREFHNRNPVTRGLVKICLNHPKPKKLITKNLEQIVRFSESLHLPVLSRIACSTLFNLSYYQGIADELGDSRLFLDNVRRKRLPPPM
jgi:GT2 family glycosyltransferase